MPSLSVARAFNTQFSPSFIPVAVFVGGTSGIGQGMAEAFARYTNGNAHIVIIGRNREAAQSIISSFPKPTITKGGEPPLHEFVSCDATLMKNVHATVAELLSRLPKINFLVLSPGYLSLHEKKTEEGIDARFAPYYYARWKFTHDLLPLLRNAVEAGEQASVMFVLTTSKGGEIDLDDLGLRNSSSFVKAANTFPTYHDLAIEVSLARSF
jgi:NAD(P)-dependent dehydrogenase (short-subunit alcohol dehydrogenase family)